MFINKEFKKVLSGYRYFTGNRIYALYETLGPKQSRRERTRQVCEMLQVPYNQAVRAIEWGYEKQRAEIKEMYIFKKAA
jgi:hypothetical protein